MEDLKQENKKLKQQVSVLEQELQQYTEEGPERFKYELNRWVNNATEYIKKKSSNIGDLVTGEGKDFERMMVLIKNTKEAVETIASLTSQGIIGKKGKEDEGIPFIETLAETRN